MTGKARGASDAAPAVRRPSLQVRLALVATVVLIAGLGAIGWTLDRSFNAAVRTGAQDHLRAVVFGLLGAAQERAEGLAFPGELGEPRLGQAGSGLLAYVDESGGDVLWLSPSAILSGGRVAQRQPLERRPRPGEFRFEEVRADDEPSRYVFAYTVVWEALGSELTFWVLADQAPYRLQVVAFRRSAAIGLAAVGIVFLGIQLAALRWGLRPVRAMAERVQGLEAGTRSDIGADYPSELAGLARNLNHFIAFEAASRDRYRRAMEDLAHSLKTPLSVLKNAVGAAPGDGAGSGPLLREQLERMEVTVAHQLARAAAARGAAPTERVAVLPVAARIVRALRQAYAEKGVTVALLPSEDCDLAVRVDEHDVMEMLGNLIENGFKYTRRHIRISARVAASRRALRIAVEDDGAGVPLAQRRAILQRGARGGAGADGGESSVPGHGVGLAVVADLAAGYGGSLRIDDSAALGGASFCLELPRAA